MDVEKWLTHWVENIAAANVRPTTMVGYRALVYKHLIPGVGAHRLEKLQPEHLEKLYGRMISHKGLKPATAHLAHRTVRVALNEAVRRGHIVQNPAKVAKPPRVEEEDIRHTAATMLLVLKVPLPAVMDIMGWSDASIAKRYMHVPRELVTAIAAEVGALMRAKTD